MRQPDPTNGVIGMLISIMAFMAFYYGRENGRRSASMDLEDCERQIESIRRQIHELEAERSDIDVSLPTNIDSLQRQLRESESLVVELKSLLPTYHAQQAAMESYKAARQRATRAA